jgi:hypothetical protein
MQNEHSRTKTSRMNIRRISPCILTMLVVSIVLTLTACKMENTGLSQTTSINHLFLTFNSNHSRVRVGDTVQMRFTITNRDQQPIVIESRDRPVLDILIAPAGGDVIRSWSTENPDKVSHRVEWKPSESKTLEFVWNVTEEDRLSPLIYLIGTIHIDPNIEQSAYVTVCLEGFCR